MTNIFFISASFIFFSLQCFSAENSQDDLKRIIQMGVDRAFGLQAQKLRLDNSLTSRLNSYAALLPALTLSGGRSISRSESISSGDKTVTTTGTNSLNLGAEWTIWNQFQNVRDVKLAHYDVDIERIRTNLELQNYIISVITQYYDLQVLYSQRFNLDEALKMHRGLLKEAQEMYRLGAKTKLDVMDSEILVQNYQRDMNEMNIQIANAERTMKVLLNSNESVQLASNDLSSNKPYFIEAFEEKFEKSKETVLDQIGTTSPDFRVSHLRLDRSLEQLHQTRLSYFPTTTVRLTHDLSFENYVNSVPSTDRVPLRGTVLSLNFTWPIWDWFNTYRNIDISNRDFEIQQINLKETALRLRIDTQNQIEQYEILKQSVKISENVVKQAEQQLDYTKALYEVGRINLLQAQVATTRLLDARIALMNRFKSLYVLAARLWVQSGNDLLPEGMISGALKRD